MSYRYFVFDDSDENTYEDNVAEEMSLMMEEDIDIRIPASDVRRAWQKYSDSMAASWMHHPNDAQEIFNTIQSYLTEIED